MDKRKLGEELDGHSAKRRKSDNPEISTGETVETTKRAGLELLEILRKTTDKNGRLIATHFESLPNKRQYADYYELIKLPIALDTINAKLRNGDFASLTALESYFKRMIQNARQYNQRGSEVHEDAERLRKALSNFMRDRNPAYKLIPGYTAVPTPIPGEEGSEGGDIDDANGEGDEEVDSTRAAKRKPGRPPKNSQAQRLSATPALSDFQYAGVSFDGLTFQKAQEKIVEDMIREKEYENDEFGAFEPFIKLPSRIEYKDYYRTIKSPVSLKSLQNKVKGGSGKNVTGISEFKNWAAFEEEASMIWKNAFEYNQDGSAIFILAKELQNFFKKSFEKAKAAVPEPVGPKIKLKMPEPAREISRDSPRETPKITLKFPSKASPGESPAPQPVAQPASQANGRNGTPVPIAPATNATSRQNPFRGPSSSGTPAPNLEQLERARSMSGSVPSPTPSNSAPVKNEELARVSPALAAGQLDNRAPSQVAPSPVVPTVGMLPPSTPGLTNSLTQGGYAQSFNHHAQYQNPNPTFESKWRQPGKTAADAMITNLSLATHPGLNISRHFRMDLPPSPTMAQQSITINLPSTHYYLQIKPTLSVAIMERQHKLFVTSGNQRLHAMPTIPGHAVDQRHPLFEARLHPGVNRIEIELIAALPRGMTKLANVQDAELEKITVFANLMRS